MEGDDMSDLIVRLKQWTHECCQNASDDGIICIPVSDTLDVTEAVAEIERLAKALEETKRNWAAAELCRQQDANSHIDDMHYTIKRAENAESALAAYKATYQDSLDGCLEEIKRRQQAERERDEARKVLVMVLEYPNCVTYHPYDKQLVDGQIALARQQPEQGDTP